MIKNLSYVFVLAAMFTNTVYGLNSENAKAPTNYELMMQFVNSMDGDVRMVMNNLINEERENFWNARDNMVHLHDLAQQEERNRLYAKHRIKELTDEADLKKAAFETLDADLKNFSIGFWINNGMPDYQLVKNTINAPRSHARMLATFKQLGEEHILAKALNELFDDLNIRDYICNSTRLDIVTHGLISVEKYKEIKAYINSDTAETTTHGWYKLPSTYPFMMYYHRNAGLFVSLVWNYELPSVICSVNVSTLQN